MADRYQSRAYSAANHADRNHTMAPQSEGDPLAELARLIGQTDPLADYDRAPQPPAEPKRERVHFRPSAPPPEDIVDEPELPESNPAGPPPWMLTRATPQRATAQQPVQDDLHPVRRYATSHSAPAPSYHEPEPVYPEQQQEYADPARYDDALYGSVDHALGGSTRSGQPQDDYADESYAYRDGYDDFEAEEEEAAKPRRGGLKTVIAVLALAVVGTGAAFGYRTYVGSPRSGEPPIIKADAGPNKVVPAPATDSSGKQIQDRVAAAGNAAEQIVSREEQPVDVKDIAKGGPRVVFPPLNQNANPPSTASVAPNGRMPPNTANGTIAGNEPRKIKTFSVRSDQPDPAARPTVASRAPAPNAAPSPAAPATTRAAPAPTVAVPIALAPQNSNAAHTQVASTNPTQAAPAATTGGYVVQVSSQRNEADARASFKALQAKFPSSLASRSPLIKRADLGAKGVYYRAMVGPFASSDEASQFCGGLKSAGGQCVVQRN
ncbi:MAG: hypothetical protein BGP05_21265 [Rhizobiales bacterium 62-47]|nr:SPOR domain-containing protein [Hyphomicrobiales bacterium]OJY10223.1 MAG: hypothetical protein BGP05_21265 [Rhizobiales bacterium 62-47]